MAKNRNRDQVNIVIESGHQNVGDCERIFNDLKVQLRRDGINVLGTFSVELKSECHPLMTADLLAAVHSMVNKHIKQGTIDPEAIKLPPGSNKRGLALLELTPDALRQLKIGFEEERQKGVQQWFAKHRPKSGPA